MSGAVRIMESLLAVPCTDDGFAVWRRQSKSRSVGIGTCASSRVAHVLIGKPVSTFPGHARQPPQPGRRRPLSRAPVKEVGSRYPALVSGIQEDARKVCPAALLAARFSHVLSNLSRCGRFLT